MAITEFFHLIHVVDDEDEVDAWYDAVFAPKPFIRKSWTDIEKRWASLSLIGDFIIEVIEPSDALEHQEMPLSKFRTRFGQHFHSLAWYTDGGAIKPLFDRMRSMGVRVAKPGGGIWPEGDIDPGPTIFTHPKDTFGQLEFVDVEQQWRGRRPAIQTRLVLVVAPRPASTRDPPRLAFHDDRRRYGPSLRAVRESARRPDPPSSGSCRS